MKRRILFSLFLIFALVHVSSQNLQFDQYFTDKTMRIDYNHAGNLHEEHFSLQEILYDGPWPGSKLTLIDPLNLGIYLFEIRDKESKMLIYSRGFSSIFAEWQTTPEAHDYWGSYNESMRFPWPKKPVELILKKRDSRNKFNQVWDISIDPDSRQIVKADIKHTEKVDIIFENGPVQEKVDLVILGDGYMHNEMDKFQGDAMRLTNALFSVEPFKSRKNDFNVRAVETPSPESGITKPHHGIYKRSYLSAKYSSFDSERYILAFDNHTIRNVASAVPYDFMIILINEQTYGGGGIYNLYTTVSADNLFASYIMIHELGHHMAALADEYYASSVAYEIPDLKYEPWETNITTVTARNSLKWKDLIDESTPLPTRWDKTSFDDYEFKIQKTRDSLRAFHVNENIMEDLFTNELKKETMLFESERYKNAVGAFEGAGYAAKGMYRPQLDCIMFTRNIKYCKVCSRSLEIVMDAYTH